MLSPQIDYYYDETHRIIFGRSVESLQKKFLLDKALEYRTSSGYFVSDLIVYNREIYEVTSRIYPTQNYGWNDIIGKVKLINDAADPIDTWADWHLIPAERPSLPMPERKETTYEMDGVNGVVDISDSLTGYTVYENRSDSFEFYALPGFSDWASRYDFMQAYLSGKRVYFLLTDDPGYFYEGFVNVETYEAGDNVSTVTFNYNVKPYKFFMTKSDEPWLWDPFNFENGIVQYPRFSNIVVNVDTSADNPTVDAEAVEDITKEYNQVLRQLRAGRYGVGERKFNRLKLLGYDSGLLRSKYYAGNSAKVSVSDLVTGTALNYEPQSGLDVTSKKYTQMFRTSATYLSRDIGSMAVTPLITVEFGRMDGGIWKRAPFFADRQGGTWNVGDLVVWTGRLYKIKTRYSGTTWKPGNADIIPATVALSSAELDLNTDFFELIAGENEVPGITFSNKTGVDLDVSDRPRGQVSLKYENTNELNVWFGGLFRATITFRGGQF